MEYDIIIIGAGPAGLSFARDLASTDLNIAIIEKQNEETLENPAYDGREIALTHLSHKIMTDLGMWDVIPSEKISLIKKAKVLNGTSPYSLKFCATETSEDNLGFMISNNAIRKAAYDVAKECSNITLLTEKEVSDIGTDDEKAWIDLKTDEHLTTPLIVSADSRFSTTRRQMGISTSMLDFGRTCIVCTMDITGDHEDTAYECFHFDRTLAVLPLNNKRVSVVITLPADEDEEVLNISKEEFSKDIENRIEGKFGTMTLSSELFPYPLVGTFAKTFCAKRFAVIGDAAVGMHPVTAHGFNLGLSGGHTLANGIKQAIGTGIDYASGTVVENYSREHRRASAPLYHGTNALVTLYTQKTHTAKLARGALLRLGNRLKPVKNMIMDQLTEIKSL